MKFSTFRRNSLQITNPILQDTLIANDLFLYAIHKSIFRYHFVISYDYFAYLNNGNYKNPHLKLKLIKYDLNETTISEIVRSLNSVSICTIKQVNKVKKISDKKYIVPVSFVDTDEHEITSISFTIEKSTTETNKSICDRKWIDLPLINEKLYAYVDVKERVFCDLLKEFLYDRGFYPDLTHLKRLNRYIQSTLNLRLIDICLTKDLKAEGFKDRVEYIDAILDFLTSETYDGFDVKNIISYLSQLKNN